MVVDKEEALSIAGAIASNLEDAQVIIYSDTQFEIDRSNYHSIVINRNSKNAALGGLSYSMQDGDIVVLSKIKSYGYDGNVKLECLSDGKLIDVKELDIEDGESLDIYWRDVPDTARTIQVNLDVDDNLTADNSAYIAIEAGREYRAVLVSEEISS